MTANIISSPLLPEPTLPATTVAQLMYERLSSSSDAIQIVNASTRRKWTKRQVLAASLNFAAYLLSNGCALATGDVVLIVAENSDIHAIAILGILSAGGVYGSAPEHSCEREIREIVSTVKPRLLIGFEDNIHVMEKISSENKDIKSLLLNNSCDADTKGDSLTVEQIFHISTPCVDSLPIIRGGDSMATLVMSSGSTGKPKAIIRTNRNILATIETFRHKELCPLTSDDVYLSSGFIHICGQKALFGAIEAGAQLLVIPNDESHEDVFNFMARYSVTACVLVPTQLNYLVKNGHKFNKSSFPALRDVMTGAASLSASTHKAVTDMFGFEYFRNSYGMSECGFALTVPYSDRNQLSNRETVGKVNPGVQMKVIDANDNALPANQIGQLCIRGDQVSPGYLNSAKNKGLFTSDGFLKSEDIGYYDEKGFFYFVDRIKNIFKVDGVSVIPVELEHILVGHKDVENAAVIGIKDDARGEIPMAFVTLVEGSDVSEETLVEYVNARVNDFKKLRGGVRVLDSMPVTHSGKICKTQLLNTIVI